MCTVCTLHLPQHIFNPSVACGPFDSSLWHHLIESLQSDQILHLTVLVDVVELCEGLCLQMGCWLGVAFTCHPQPTLRKLGYRLYELTKELETETKVLISGKTGPRLYTYVYIVPPEKCNLAQCSFCAILTMLMFQFGLLL